MRSVASRAAALYDAAERVVAGSGRLVARLVRHRLRTFTVAMRDVAVARQRLLALAEAEASVEGRHPAGTVAILLPDNAALSASLTTIGAALLSGNRVAVRLPRRTAWPREALESMLTPAGALHDPAAGETQVPGGLAGLAPAHPRRPSPRPGGDG